MFGKTRIGVTLNILKTNHKLFDKKFIPNISLHGFPLASKNDLVTRGIMVEVSLLYGAMREHHLIHMSVSEESNESNLGNQDVDKNMPDILSDMLTESQKFKEDDYHIHKKFDVDSAKGDCVKI